MNASSASATVTRTGDGSAASASISRAFFSAFSQARVRALKRTKAPVVSTVPMIHFGQWQRL
jgi:hypothetical protein